MATKTFNLDAAHSQLNFSVRHLVISKVHGRFAKFGAQLALDLADFPQSKIGVDIDVASIDTQVADRDGHLRSADFFDTANHPSARFDSTSIEKTGDDRYRIHGTLTLRGATKPVTLETAFNGSAKSPWGQDVVAFSAKTQLDRREWGLTWNKGLETGGVLVGEKVDLTIELEAVAA